MDIFIDDAYNSFYKNNHFNYIFEKHELHEYNVILKKFYYQFLPNNQNSKYNQYSYILQDILPFVFKYNDLHSLVSNYIDILYVYINYYVNNTLNNDYNDYVFLYDFIKSLIKKVYYPNPKHRLSAKQFISILNFFFKYVYSLSYNDLNNKKDYIPEFMNEFTDLLKKLN